LSYESALRCTSLPASLSTAAPSRSLWSAFSGVAFVRDEQITVAGWLLTLLAAAAPVAALKALSFSGQRAVSSVLRSDRPSSSWDF
jgi:hypothetical protein